MAIDKKSFVLYSDLIYTVQKMKPEDAGELFLHILKYVNDDDPVTENMVVDLTFEPVKQQLKRDLKKYETIKEKRSEAGKKSAEKRAKEKLKNEQKETNSTSVESVKQTSTNSTVSVNVNGNVNVNDTVNEKVIKEKVEKTLLSELKNSDVLSNYLILNKDQKEEHVKVALMFQELFYKNIKSIGGVTKKVENAKAYAWVDPIRKLIVLDKINKIQFRTVYDYLEKADFWKPNILCTSKLRGKFNELLLNANTEINKKNGKQNTTKATESGIKGIINDY